MQLLSDVKNFNGWLWPVIVPPTPSNTSSSTLAPDQTKRHTARWWWIKFSVILSIFRTLLQNSLSVEFFTFLYCWINSKKIIAWQIFLFCFSHYNPQFQENCICVTCNTMRKYSNNYPPIITAKYRKDNILALQWYVDGLNELFCTTQHNRSPIKINNNRVFRMELVYQHSFHWGGKDFIPPTIDHISRSSLHTLIIWTLS